MFFLCFTGTTEGFICEYIILIIIIVGRSTERNISLVSIIL